MKNEHLRSHLMSFLVILKRESDDVVGILEDLVHEGVLVKILLEDSGGKFGIFIPHVNTNGRLRFINKGNWSIARIALSKNLVEPNRLSQQYSVNGRHMTVAGKNAWPAFKLGTTLPDGTIEPESGVDAYILRALSSTLNFTYHVVPSPDDAWGGRQADGTVTGIIGMVARREADFAVTFTGITENRESVTDFTFPYIQGKLRLFSRSPKEKNRALAILSPFSSMVSIRA
ncbi:probable glutamate receptor [Palaemon carinicauda]|uniref:probable glutamate receptor n=1 Tax=Palaemon carinicauda TaxID=392227 RepID=UPI0035B5FA2D